MNKSKWYTKRQFNRIVGIEAERLKEACQLLVGDVKQSFTAYKVAQAGGRRITKIAKGKGRKKYHVVSAPGEPPAVDKGQYRGSFTFNVFITGVKAIIIGRVGTNQKRAKRLEYGYVGTDKRGRRINQAPRPHLHPAFRRMKGKIMAILSGK